MGTNDDCGYTRARIVDPSLDINFKKAIVDTFLFVNGEGQRTGVGGSRMFPMTQLASFLDTLMNQELLLKTTCSWP